MYINLDINSSVVIQEARKHEYQFHVFFKSKIIKLTNSANYKTMHVCSAITDPADCTSYPCVIFNDQFDTLDMKAWEHEITLGGGGVSILTL